MRILGIDPSLKSTGYGIIDDREGRPTLVKFGTITPSNRLPLPERLNQIRREIEGLIAEYEPEEVAIENPFYARNIKTALILGQVRGAVLVALAAYSRPLHEYSALEIKKAVTGYGQADKNQVLAMIRTLLDIQGPDLGSDAADALAAAFCHSNVRAFQERIEGSRKQEEKNS